MEDIKAEEVVPVMPPGPDDFDFDQIDCLPEGPEVTITDDFELLMDTGSPVLEMIGEESKIVFFTACKLPLIGIHIKNIDRFMSLAFTLTDTAGGTRVVNFNTKRSLVTVDKNLANLPIVIGEGWQYLCLDFRLICQKAFGCSYASCSEVAVHGSCRLGKVFFMQREMADVELPPFLRVCQPQAN
jgi:hypothetical protein